MSLRLPKYAVHVHPEEINCASEADSGSNSDLEATGTRDSSPSLPNIRRRFSVQARVEDGVYQTRGGEVVPYGQLSAKMLSEIHEQPPTEFNSRLLCDLVWATCTLVAAATAVALMVFAPPWSSPHDTFDANKYFFLVSLPAGSFAVIIGVAYFVTIIVHIKITFRRLAGCTLLCSGFMVAVSIFSKVVLDIFPIPYFMVTIALPTAILLFILIYFTYPKSIRRSPGFKFVMVKTFAVTLLNVGTVLCFVLFNAIFVSADSELQSFLAFLLPMIKVLVKVSTKMVCTKYLNNPNGAHAAGYFVECTCGAISAVIFTNINDPLSFALILAVDIGENLFYGFSMLVQIIDVWRTSFMETKSLLDDEKEKHELLATKGAMEKIRTAHASGSIDRVHSTINQKMESCEDILSHPTLAFLCANLFFSELTECVVPLLMMILSVSVYYLSEKCSFMAYMNDKTEEQFLRGVKYAMIDTALELFIFLAYAAFLQKKAGVDLIRVGRHIMAQNSQYFFFMTIAACLYFQFMFIQHVGTDTSFQFDWLREGFNATEAVTASDDGHHDDRCYRP
mmetsp:Transcript_23490/g.48850  ORF Transcript_23490/g.48850 Transcript_23490/m.48850 type:complete len:564 (+) Transcript_23490:176-1867(+)